MRILAMLFVATSLSVLGAGCQTTVTVEDPVVPVDATLTVANDSSFVITEIRLASVHSSTWGPSLIADAIFPGESVVITDIACGSYDVMVTDETDLDCVLSDLRLCFSDHTWFIDDGVLDACAFGKK